MSYVRGETIGKAVRSRYEEPGRHHGAPAEAMRTDPN